MPQISIPDLMKDQDFLGLPEIEKSKVLETVLPTDQDFMGLPDAEKASVMNRLVTLQPPQDFQQTVDQHDYMGKGLKGILETGAAMGTGLVGQAVGGLRGIYDVATGKTPEQAAADIAATSQALTYQPRTETGQAITGTLGEAMDWVNKKVGQVGGIIGEAVGGEQGRIVGESVGEAALPVVGTLAGAPAALRGAKGVATAAKAAKAAKEADRILKAAEKSQAASPRIEAANLAKQYGLKMSPKDLEPTMTQKGAVWIAGERDVNEALRAFNEAKVGDIVKTELGIDKKIPLTQQKSGFNPFEAKRKAKGAVYEEMKQVGNVSPEHFKNLVAEVNNVAATEGMSPAAIELMRKQLPQQWEGLISLAQKDGLTAADIVQNVKQLRKEVNSIYKMEATGTATPEAIALAEKQGALASALENALLRRVQEVAQVNPARFGDLAKRFKDAREYISRSHIYENATDLTTGRVDVSKLARQAKQGTQYTGFLRDVGHITGNFPNVMKAQSAPTMLDIAKSVGSRYSLPVIGGTAAATATLGPFFAPLGFAIGVGAEKLAATLMKKRLLSNKFQRQLSMPDFRPAQPIPMQFHKPSIATTKSTKAMEKQYYGNVLKTFNQDDYRGLLTFADDVERAAQKKMASSPEGMDFPLRQEVLQYEDIARATQDFVRESERLKGLIVKSQGFWKNKYAEQLRALEDDFMAGMEQLGIGNAGEAHGLNRPLYEAGKPTKLPIVKTK